jgi:nitrate reductase NapAB chaperone NapD
MNELATLEGVASSSLVYHQIENESLPEEPQINETVTP